MYVKSLNVGKLADCLQRIVGRKPSNPTLTVNIMFTNIIISFPYNHNKKLTIIAVFDYQTDFNNIYIGILILCNIDI